MPAKARSRSSRTFNRMVFGSANPRLASPDSLILWRPLGCISCSLCEATKASQRILFTAHDGDGTENLTRRTNNARFPVLFSRARSKLHFSSASDHFANHVCMGISCFDQDTVGSLVVRTTWYTYASLSTRSNPSWPN